MRYLAWTKAFPDLKECGAFRVGEHIRTVQLEQIRFDPESGLAGTGPADNQDVFVSGVGRIFGAVAHHQTLCPGQDDVVLKHRIDKWLNIFFRAP